MLQKQLKKDYKMSTGIVDKNRRIWYSEVLACSLVVFAMRDKSFSQELRKMVEKFQNCEKITNTYSFPNSIEVLVPQDASYALRRAEWLVDGIVGNKFSGSKGAMQVLSSWIKDDPLEVPKQIVIGLVGVAIPGPTLGILTKKRKLTSVVREDLAQKLNLDLVKKTVGSTHALLMSALEMAGGNIRKLEPEIGDWFFGDREISFYTASEEKMIFIEKELKGLGVIHSSSRNNEKFDVITMSPAVNISLDAGNWDLEPLEE